MAVKLCPKCGGKVAESRNECIHCGFVFTKEKQCPECEAFVPCDVSECPECGHLFNKTGNLDLETALQNTATKQKTEIKNEDDLTAYTECPYCGSDAFLEIGNDYCMCLQCHNKYFNNNSQTSSCVMPAPNPLLENNVHQEIVVSANKNETIEENTEKEKAKKKRKQPLAVFVLICAIISIIGVFAIAIFSFIKFRNIKTFPYSVLGNILVLSVSILAILALLFGISLFIRSSKKQEQKKTLSSLIFSCLSIFFVSGLVVSSLLSSPYQITSRTIITAASDHSMGFREFGENISIPSSLYGQTVNYISPSFMNGNDYVKTLTIPDSVISIGGHAFASCESLKTVTVYSKNKMTIRSSVFMYCKSLETVNISNDVSFIGSNGFFYCESLERITLPANLKNLSYGTFQYCRSLKQVELPDGLASIDGYAFFCCESLPNIFIPKNVVSIGDHAFDNCYSLRTIAMPYNLTSIGECAFASCRSIQEIIIPNSVTSIGRNAFMYCSRLFHVFYTGTLNQWTSISGYSTASLDSSSIYFYSANQPSSSGRYWHYVNGVPTVWQ